MADEFVLQLSVKTPKGSMLNVRGRNPDEYAASLQAALSDEVLTASTRLEELYQFAGNAGPLVAPSGDADPAPRWSQDSAPAPQAAPAQPAALYGYCDCNPQQPRKRVEFTAKSGPKQGQKGAFYACPKPQGQQCGSKEFERS